MKKIVYYKHVIAGMSIMFLLTACNDIFGGLYDEPEENDGPQSVPGITEKPSNNDSNDEKTLTVTGSLYVDASSWKDWHYIDLPTLHQAVMENKAEEVVFPSFPIPTTASSEGDGKDGLYYYWFDVMGIGLSNNHLCTDNPAVTPFVSTAKQEEPEQWSIAVHREVARTNNGEVLMTAYTSFEELPESSDAFKGESFTKDEWSENDTWVDQKMMMAGIVGCQGININKVLSKWLTCNIPPLPPSYSMDNRVFIVRFADGTCAALQLKDYVSTKGTKCCLTINYKYPY